METPYPSIFQRLRARLFPKMPDFYAILTEQSRLVAATTGLLVDFMETNAPSIAARIVQDEHDQDDLKVQNLIILNEAFATPMDREDIYRALLALDDVTNYCKTTIREMEILGVTPDQHTLEAAMHIHEGAQALAAGFAKLAHQPLSAGPDADLARKAERRTEKSYRRALSVLFQGTDYLNMFKRREIYRHLSNAADRVSAAGSSLQDILVKLV
ncbi:MAG: DUF47 family protein [Verrucomicrobiaceae bacterium]|nr:DUF47 family protein [Verrucomicrobiaceae bacterium]